MVRDAAKIWSAPCATVAKGDTTERLHGRSIRPTKLRLSPLLKMALTGRVNRRSVGSSQYAIFVDKVSKCLAGQGLWVRPTASTHQLGSSSHITIRDFSVSTVSTGSPFEKFLIAVLAIRSQVTDCNECLHYALGKAHHALGQAYLAQPLIFILRFVLTARIIDTRRPPSRYSCAL